MRAFAQRKRLNIPPPAYAGPPPWLLRRAALHSNATFTPKEVGQPKGLAFSEAESVEAL